jgi:hypothetical protein
MNTLPAVSVVLVSFNTRDLTRECLVSLFDELQQSGIDGEVIVVDNASRDGSADTIAHEFPSVRLVRSEQNLGFGNANNQGFPLCSAPYVILLNTDAFLHRGSLKCALAHMEMRPSAGLGGALLIGRDGSPQPSARCFPTALLELFNLSGLAARFPQSHLFGRLDRTWADPRQPAEVDWVPGAFSIVRRDLLERIGYFDPCFFLYYEEVDLCRRIKNAGAEVWYWPDVVVTHIGGESSKTVTHLTMASRGSQLTLWRMRSQLLYYRKWHGAATAAWVRWQEESWHRMRAARNRSRAPEKSAESKVIVKLWQQAWSDTRGGSISPPQPW